jgi:hypothetical protein
MLNYLRGVMVFNTTFNTISVLLIEETGVPGKNTDMPLITDNLYYIMTMLYRVHLPEWDLNYSL